MPDFDSTRAPCREAVNVQKNGREQSSRLSLIIVGTMRKLYQLRVQRGIPVDVHSWMQVIAAELDELDEVNLRHWGRWLGLGNLPSGLTREIVGCERDRRQRKRRLSRKTLGQLLDLTTAERDELRFWLPIAVDETPEAGRRRRARERAETALGAAKLSERAAERKKRDRSRKAAQRRDEGRPTQEDRSRAGAERRAAIAASGLSPATYYRRLKRAAIEKVASLENVTSTRGLKGDLNRSDTMNEVGSSDLAHRRGTVPCDARLPLKGTRIPGSTHPPLTAIIDCSHEGVTASLVNLTKSARSRLNPPIQQKRCDKRKSIAQGSRTSRGQNARFA